MKFKVGIAVGSIVGLSILLDTFTPNIHVLDIPVGIIWIGGLLVTFCNLISKLGQSGEWRTTSPGGVGYYKRNEIKPSPIINGFSLGFGLVAICLVIIFIVLKIL